MYFVILVASVVVTVTIVRNLSRRISRQSANDNEPVYAGYPANDFSSYREPSNIDRDELYLNLRKTINWTNNIVANIENTSAIDYSRALRTVNPLYNGKPFYSWYSADEPWVVTPNSFDYPAILDQVIKPRTDTALIESVADKGKILVFEIDITTHDGAPIAESNGFVDESDIPPIDTWFFVTKKYLYCWIPTLFIGKIQDAIDVEILGSYTWLEEAMPDLNKQILDKVKM